MSKPARLAQFVAAAGVTAALLCAVGDPAAIAQPQRQPRSASKGHSYTCSNKGGASNHTVYCIGQMTFNNVLNETTVNIGDPKILSDSQIGDLQLALVNISDNDVNVDVNVQLADLEKAVIVTYLEKFAVTLTADKVEICAPTMGVCS
jgi:hypothetical protein